MTLCLSVSLWLSVSVYVCLLQVGVISKNERITAIFDTGLLLTSPSLCFKKIQVSTK